MVTVVQAPARSFITPPIASRRPPHSARRPSTSRESKIAAKLRLLSATHRDPLRQPFLAKRGPLTQPEAPSKAVREAWTPKSRQPFRPGTSGGPRPPSTRPPSTRPPSTRPPSSPWSGSGQPRFGRGAPGGRGAPRTARTRRMNECTPHGSLIFRVCHRCGFVGMRQQQEAHQCGVYGAVATTTTPAVKTQRERDSGKMGGEFGQFYTAADKDAAERTRAVRCFCLLLSVG